MPPIPLFCLAYIIKEVLAKSAASKLLFRTVAELSGFFLYRSLPGYVSDRGRRELPGGARRSQAQIMKRELIDRKSWLTYSVFALLNKLAVHTHFEVLDIIGRENIPREGPFLLVSNHISRWDGPVAYEIISRPANFMVSPNELLGLQGLILRSMGSFPANPRFAIQDFVLNQMGRGEGVVIFPEGDIFRDGTTHAFKPGAARLALNCAREGLDFPVVPMAIRYSQSGTRAMVMVAPPVELQSYLDSHAEQPQQAVSSLTVRLHREVSHLRYCLGELGDRISLFTGRGLRSWASLTCLPAPRQPAADSALFAPSPCFGLVAATDTLASAEIK